MSDTVWISQVRTDSRIGNKQGMRAKFYGHEWEPPEFTIPVPSENVLDAHRRQRKGLTLDRSEMTEAVAIWDESRFSKKGDLFYAGPFMAVRGKLAEVLADFNLGAGGLFPLPVFKADLTTPVVGDFFLLNFGGQKDTLVPAKSTGLEKLHVESQTGIQIWGARSDLRDEAIALSPDALAGTDLWCERTVFNSIFMSDALAQALRTAKIKIDFRLSSCRIVQD